MYDIQDHPMMVLAFVIITGIVLFVAGNCL